VVKYDLSATFSLQTEMLRPRQTYRVCFGWFLSV